MWIFFERYLFDFLMVDFWIQKSQQKYTLFNATGFELNKKVVLYLQPHCERAMVNKQVQKNISIFFENIWRKKNNAYLCTRFVKRTGF
jgi:hypothetical protein